MEASFYFTGTILIRRNTYTIFFKFSLIKSRVGLG